LPTKRDVAAFLTIFALQAIPAYLIISSGLDSNLFYRFFDRFEAAPELMLTAFILSMASITIATVILYSRGELEDRSALTTAVMLRDPRYVYHRDEVLWMIGVPTVIAFVLRGICSLAGMGSWAPLIYPAIRFATTTFTAWLVTPAYLAYSGFAAFHGTIDQLVNALVYVALAVASAMVFALPPYLAARLGDLLMHGPLRGRWMGELPDKARSAPRFKKARQLIVYWLSHRNPAEVYRAVQRDWELARQSRAYATYAVLDEALWTVTHTKEYVWLHHYKSFLADGYRPGDAAVMADRMLEKAEATARDYGEQWVPPGKSIKLPELQLYHEWQLLKEEVKLKREPAWKPKEEPREELKEEPTKEEPTKEPQAEKAKEPAKEPEAKKPDKLPYVV